MDVFDTDLNKESIVLLASFFLIFLKTRVMHFGWFLIFGELCSVGQIAPVGFRATGVGDGGKIFILCFLPPPAVLLAQGKMVFKPTFSSVGQVVFHFSQNW